MKKIVLVIFSVLSIVATTFAQTYTSQNNRTQDWNDNATWGTTPPSTSISGTVNVYGKVSLTGNLSVTTSGGATLRLYDTLTVSGSFTNNGVFTTAANTVLNVASFDNTSSGSATATIGGAVNVSGSFTSSNDVTIQSGAVVTVDGDYTNANSGAATLDVYGTLIIKGNLTTSNSIRVRPGGLLIVIGNVTGTNAGATAIINEGNTVAVGEFSMAGDVTTNDQFFLFDDSPTYDWGATIDGTNWNGSNGGTLTNEFPTESSIPSWIWDILNGLGVSCAGSNTASGAQTICNNSTPAALTGSALSGVTYLWESSTTSATTGFTTAAGTATNQNYTPGTLTQTTWYRRRIIKASPSCTHYSSAIQVTVFNGSVWTGASNNRLDTPGNWCGGVPTSLIDALIPTGKSTYPATRGLDVNNLIIESGASLNLENGRTITIYGNFTNSGTLSFTSTTGSSIMSFQGTTQQTITGGPYTFPNLTVNSGTNQVVFSSNVTVNRILNLQSGIINMSGSTLIHGSGYNNATNVGTFNYTTGRIANGTLTRNINTGNKTNLMFPMGTLSDNRPFYFSGNVTTGGTMSVSHTGSSTTTTGLSITDSGTIERRQNSSWSISVSNLASGALSISAGGTGFGTIGDLDHLRLMRAASTVPGSTHVAASGSLTDFVASRSGVSLANLTGGALYVGSINGTITPLPVELLFFAGTNHNDFIQLDWATAIEDNFLKFEIERSSTGKDFVKIGEVLGFGSDTKERHNYSFTDSNPLIGKNYYRLRRMDNDEFFEYSNVIVIDGDNDRSMVIFPNPVEDSEISVRINFEPTASDRIIIIDNMGQVRAEYNPSSIESKIPLSIGKGSYLIRYITNNKTFTSRFVVSQ